MADTFVKLYRSILTSSVWVGEPPPTKIVWITMLALADWQGNVWASVPGLAHTAGVSMKDCENALKVLSGPDRESRTKTDEGRRIRAIDGGWHLINHAKYREFRTPVQIKTAARTRKWRKNLKAKAVTGDDVTGGDAQIQIQNEIQIQKQKQNTTTDNGSAPSGRAGRETWITPYEQAWIERWGEGSEAPIGEMLKAFGKKHKTDPEELLRRWKRFLYAAETSQWARPVRFIQGWGEWSSDLVRRGPQQRQSSTERTLESVKAFLRKKS